MKVRLCLIFVITLYSVCGTYLRFIPNRAKRQTSMFCSDNSQAVARAINAQCNSGYRHDATTGYCCVPSVATWPVCPSGINATAACTNLGLCGAGYTCTNVTTSSGPMRVCCGNRSPANTCNAPNVNIGPCINGACPVSYQCVLVNNQNICCGPSQGK